MLSADVRASNTYVIECHCEAIIPAYLAKAVGPIVGLIESNQNLSDTYHLTAALTLTLPDIDYRVIFRLINPTNQPVLPHKGTSTRKFSVLTEKDQIILPVFDPIISTIENPSVVASHESTSQFNCLPSGNLTLTLNSHLKLLVDQYSDILLHQVLT